MIGVGVGVGNITDCRAAEPHVRKSVTGNNAVRCYDDGLTAAASVTTPGPCVNVSPGERNINISM